MSGRPAAACALYAGFLAAWALATAVRRRHASPYLPLGIALLEATLLLGALVGLSGLGGSEVAVHLGYLLASVLILPIGWMLAATPAGRRDPLTLAVALVVLVVVILRVDATAV